MDTTPIETTYLIEVCRIPEVNFEEVDEKIEEAVRLLFPEWTVEKKNGVRHRYVKFHTTGSMNSDRYFSLVDELNKIKELKTGQTGVSLNIYNDGFHSGTWDYI
ncbi:hypothetical protein P10VF_181 [Rhizobium phage vB_RleM_P10VF]|uniref:Uncharacterized protein n=1 Tax=Rhizobium phage vB_RleM_P10VF TaxID=1527770 RepID=A0A076YNL8_9CAUD|nr:hypothetical protein P10VF_181 [Rhizobium phage vB_RleM_P10VF]AIK68394.1 hypothetical protein P10VF_181 [Rhizobium phage vB_RleM_P10VF]